MLYLSIQQGNRPITHIADDNEYLDKLKKKLKEAVPEFDASEGAEERIVIQEIWPAS